MDNWQIIFLVSLGYWTAIGVRNWQDWKRQRAEQARLAHVREHKKTAKKAHSGDLANAANIQDENRRLHHLLADLTAKYKQMCAHCAHWQKVTLRLREYFKRKHPEEYAQLEQLGEKKLQEARAQAEALAAAARNAQVQRRAKQGLSVPKIEASTTTELRVV